MKILFDYCVLRPLRRELHGHDIKTARKMHWEGLKNGRLLDEAQAAVAELLARVCADRDETPSAQIATSALTALQVLYVNGTTEIRLAIEPLV